MTTTLWSARGGPSTLCNEIEAQIVGRVFDVKYDRLMLKTIIATYVVEYHIGPTSSTWNRKLFTCSMCHLPCFRQYHPQHQGQEAHTTQAHPVTLALPTCHMRQPNT